MEKSKIYFGIVVIAYILFCMVHSDYKKRKAIIKAREDLEELERDKKEFLESTEDDMNF